MSVVNGQIANQTTFNNAFVSRTAPNTSTISIFALNNTQPASGSSVANIQQAHNETFDAVGMTGIGDLGRKNYASTFAVANGDSHKTAIGKIDGKFGGTGTGHGHTGAAGDGAQIYASSLLGVRSGLLSLGLGDQLVSIVFADIGTTNFMPKVVIECDDAAPIAFVLTIKNRTSTGFQVDLNAPTDSANYKLHYEVTARA